MRKHSAKIVLILLAALLGFAIKAVWMLSAGTVQGEQVLVTKVFDGDTILVQRNGKEITVRLIGVDTPETSRPETPVQFYGPEAADFTRRSLEGRQVRLEFEAPGRPGGSVDHYGRTLAYVIMGDAQNFNLELVRLGYGRVFGKYPFRYQAEFRKAERAAQEAGLGIWNKSARAAWANPGIRGKIIGNINSHIYHLPGQYGYDKVREKNRVYFSTEAEARKAGFRRAKN